MQKILIVRTENELEDRNVAEEVNELLREGWRIESVTAQHVTGDISVVRGGAFLIVMSGFSGMKPTKGKCGPIENDS